MNHLKLSFFIIILLICCQLCAAGQTHTDSSRKSPVKTLTDQQYTAYLNGTYLSNLSAAAELNYYPLPDKVIKYKNELKLSAQQLKQVTELADYLRRKKIEIGASIINNERTLDSLFKTRRIDEGKIIFYGNRYGLYEGEMRTAILLACYNTKKLLTAAQINKFAQLQNLN